MTFSEIIYSLIQYVMLCFKQISYITSYVLSTCISFGENGAAAWWDVSTGPESGNPNRKGLLFKGTTWFFTALDSVTHRIIDLLILQNGKQY